MAVKLRLRRAGAKHQPRYRIVAADSRSPRDGRFLEIIGHYNPARQPHEVQINAELAQKWLSRGAQPTETVRALLVQQGILAPTARTPGEERPAAAVEAPAAASGPSPEVSPAEPQAPASEPTEPEAAAETPAPEVEAAGTEDSPGETEPPA